MDSKGCRDFGYANKLDQALSSERSRAQRNGNPNPFCYFVGNSAFRESLYPNLQALEVSPHKIIYETARTQSDASRIFTEPNFGFWTGLLGRCYEQALSPALINQAFSYMPHRQCARVNLMKHFNEVRKLRDRILHQGPTWHWLLANKNERIIEAIYWIATALAALIGTIDRSPGVYDAGTAPIEAKL